MKILLANPSFSGDVMGGFPLGLAYVSSAIKSFRNNKDEIKAIDYNNLSDSSDLERSLIDWNPDVIGFTVMVPSFTNAQEKIEYLKSHLPVSKFIVGGVGSSVIADYIYSIRGVDYIYRGEGESTFPNLLDSLEKNDRISDLQNISFKRENKLIHNSLAPFIQDLDSIPFPDRNLLPFENYLQNIHNSNRKAVSLLSSRGCPYKCVFCYRGPSSGKKFRARSVENISKEMYELREQYGVNAFMFWDDNFLLDKKRVLDLCKEIKDKDFHWKCQVRADSLDTELTKAMADSGCVSVNIGVESGNDYVLKKMKKGITKYDAEKAISLCKDYGIFTNAYFILGMPWDTLDTMNETIDFARALNPSKAQFFECTPFPGTELREIVSKMGISYSEDWNNYLLKKHEAPVMETPYFSARQLRELSNYGNSLFR